jgi:perosamine synthetase
MIPTYRPYMDREELDAIQKVLASRWLGLGTLTERLENKLENYLGVRYVILVNSCTSALHLALEALELEACDEVIVPSMTFVGSVQAIIMAGAVPVFCEIREDTLTLDLDHVSKCITERTRAIMPVHFGGVVCPINDLNQLAKAYDLKIVEDAAHAFGSTYNGKLVGSLSDITCFSFGPIKNITCGSGGAISTNDGEVAACVRMKRYLGLTCDPWEKAKTGNKGEYDVVGVGYRYHMTDLNAAIGLVQLDRIESFREKKKAITQKYDKAFEKLPGVVCVKRDLEQHFPFGYFMRILDDRRDNFVEYLKTKGIDTRIQFIPNHLHTAFSNYHTCLPVTEKIGREIVTIPLFCEMSDREINHVIASVRKFCYGIKSKKL